MYTDPKNCFSHGFIIYKLHILNTNASFGDSKVENYNNGVFICLIQRSYAVTILIESVVTFGNKGNIYIYAAEHDVSTYNLTINNSLSTGANNGHGLDIISIQDNFKQCPSSQNTSFDFTIAILNSNFTNNTVNGAVVSINVIGVKFTTRIMIQSTAICHNIGFGLNLFSYQYQTHAVFCYT